MVLKIGWDKHEVCKEFWWGSMLGGRHVLKGEKGDNIKIDVGELSFEFVNWAELC
jgi:hypothetical protein